MEKNNRPPVYYSEYLQLDKILTAQAPESLKEGVKADDEMLFIIIHQTYELWFKEILHEITIIRNIFLKPDIPDNSPDIYNSVHRLKRIASIMKVLVDQMTIMETMTALDFLDFRDLLRPASGFQSIQFKVIEAFLGLSYDHRFGKEYYISQLTPQDVALVKSAEAETSLLVLIGRWLERMPFMHDKDEYWPNNISDKPVDHPFWKTYRATYAEGLSPAEQQNLASFDMLFFEESNKPEVRTLTSMACRSALFILLYRDYPLLQLPYQLLDSLLELDSLLALWRQRHIHMVQRTIGKRVGTGGSTGAGYLKAAADSHYIFKEIAELTSFLLPRNKLPNLPEAMVKDLSYNR